MEARSLPKSLVFHGFFRWLLQENLSTPESSEANEEDHFSGEWYHCSSTVIFTSPNLMIFVFPMEVET
jgi:hypothetical protein